MITQYKTVFKFIFLILFFNNSLNQSQQLALPNQTIATVGNHQITVKDFITRFEDYLLASGVKDNIVIRRSILNNMINEIILFNYDDNKKIFDDSEYKKELKWADKQTVLAYLQDQEVFAKISVSDEEVRDAYFKSNQKIAARHLFAQTEEEANNLYQLLQTGSDFKTLAKQVFTDSTLQNNGGYLGYFSWGDMDPAFEDAAYALNVGEISKPVKTKNGYSIIKLEDRVTHPLLTEDEFLRKKAHMEKVVKIRKKKPTEIQFISKVFNSSKVKVDEKLLGNILDNLTYSKENSVERKKQRSSSAICVRYGAKSYSQNELEKRITEIPLYHLQKINSLENLKSVAKGIVLQDILFNMALKKGYDKNEEVLTTISKYHQNIFLKYKRKEVNDNTVLSDSLVMKFYNDNPQYFNSPDEINVQEIIVKRKTLADSLLTLINNNTDFGSLAEKYSVRDWSAKNKGIIGLAETTKYGILKDTLWKSEIGKVLGPIKIQTVYGIFKVLEKKNSSIKKFDQVKDDVIRLTKKEQSRSILSNYIEKVEKNVQIKIDEKLLGDVIIEN